VLCLILPAKTHKMKKIIWLLCLLTPFLLNAQDFSTSFSKTETLSWISKNIKPEGNTSSLKSLKTQATYTENFFDKNAAAIYSFNLAQVKFSIVGNKVRISCVSGSCISYQYKEPGNATTKNITHFDLDSKTSDAQLKKALNHLKTRVGL
jgi:hypothetical protein